MGIYVEHGLVKLVEVKPLKIAEYAGPLKAGNVQIGGGFALWATNIELRWTPPYVYDDGSWTLRVVVDVEVPDRQNASLPAKVGFARSYLVSVKDGKITYGDRQGDDETNWVARRIHETLEWIAKHEAAESVTLDGKPVVDAHEDDPFR